METITTKQEGQRWEYLVVRIQSIYEEEISSIINYHGRMGWELVSVDSTHFYFKRPL